MQTKFIEATNNDQNWGKFMLLRMDVEWEYRSKIDPESRRPLLNLTGWTPPHLWVLDIQTGEGALFLPGGHAKNDLRRHAIWVCPMFEPFLEWLYRQDLTDLTKLPDVINLPDAPFAIHGYRRPGPQSNEETT